MNVLDLFSGIGGFSLGLERAGMRTVAFCEIEPFCRAVLRKHWPNVPIYEDVRTLGAERLRADGFTWRDWPDLICGGFPCQDISVAGKGAGIEGSRSGLWSEYARIIGEVRPRYVIVENVAALLGRGLDRVLGDLAALRFDAEWHCIPASAVGAPHRRDRLWIAAHPQRDRFSLGRGTEIAGQEGGRPERIRGHVAQSGEQQTKSLLAHADKPRLERWLGASLSECSEERITRTGDSHWIGATWFTEPNVGRVAHGVPSRVDRLKGLGNAVVPQIPEIIGRAIMQTHQQEQT